ncbi:MAG TPA: M1 family metallopeptidase, partial [Herpetosiphonaceae bacterium]
GATFAALQRIALQPEEQAAADLPGLPRYAMALTVDPKAGTFEGTQLITYTNGTGAALPDLALRSYVNFPPDVLGDGGETEMNVLSATVDGRPAELRREAQRTLFRVTLPAPLAPGATVTLGTSFKGTLEPWDDRTWPFLSSYPMLAPWDAAAGDWRADVTRFPDHVYAESALYDVSVTLPQPYQVFATGSPIAGGADAANQTTRFVSGPVREWAASFGEFDSVSTRTNGITVTAYKAKGAAVNLPRIQDVAASALESYERRFGAYPYRELDLHAMAWSGDAGIEFPGYVVILVGGAVNQQTDVVVAHEVAHQWWYGLVGNDIYRQPWLDESFAHYSTVVATEDREGAGAAQAVYREAIVRLYDRGKAAGDPPAGLAITEYANFNSYYYAIYGKGAVFLATLREEIGDESFFGGMRAYYAAQRYGVSSRAAFQGAMETAAGRSLEPIFDQWLER